jgi:hypothetical protein
MKACDYCGEEFPFTTSEHKSCFSLHVKAHIVIEGRWANNSRKSNVQQSNVPVAFSQARSIPCRPIPSAGSQEAAGASIELDSMSFSDESDISGDDGGHEEHQSRVRQKVESILSNSAVWDNGASSEQDASSATTHTQHVNKINLAPFPG